MINADMKLYSFSTLGGADEYGQPQTTDIKGTLKMAIYITSQAIQANINYTDAKYLGLTTDYVDDTYVIDYEKEKLKVLYVNPKGRYKQVFLGAM